jgi:hypothetical protein
MDKNYNLTFLIYLQDKLPCADLLSRLFICAFGI